jgi:SAM-dependent methyltransferase
MLRRLRWFWAKAALAAPQVGYATCFIALPTGIGRPRAEDFPPNTKGYDRLAALWDDWLCWDVPPYGRFVASAGRYYRMPIQAVLDLACGTGLLTRQLARQAESVVGLDANPAMLREARARTKDPHVRYVEGDFRDFRLGESFGAVICGSDSLNYLEAASELTDVFRCVCRHLQPGGFFVFDVLGDRVFQALARVKTLVSIMGSHFVLYHFYDAGNQVSEARAVFPSEGVVERHRRIPIEAEDVRRAAKETGLVVSECFGTKGPASVSLRDFYVLRRPG